MIQGTTTTSTNFDLIIVGAGIFGLWAARHAIRGGKRILVLEKRKVGAGASGGFVGALMPHHTERWNAKKQMQFEALAGLADVIGELESDTGMTCGYRRCGRLVPLLHEQTREIVSRQIEGAREFWGGQFTMELVEPGDLARVSRWLDTAAAPHGAQWDDLSARVNPRRYVEALAAYVRAHGEIREGAEVVRLEPESRSVVLADGTRLSASEICVAAGFEAYPLLQPFMGAMNDGRAIGRGVRGRRFCCHTSMMTASRSFMKAVPMSCRMRATVWPLVPPRMTMTAVRRMPLTMEIWDFTTRR
ncbi:MAG: FAD-dependent oxidoreductase [Nitratireductor sp.]